ncbi:Cof-type HAD-IIB family hydrolase [Lacticaseibacillus daqingensis]|uniref:Cof-type HAD-IIB family hydrolase n=1 Tax=Lacticaseibacillus daqingensis TaxID=2486014 RepID=UPI000F783EEA|nr:Cof-type HAD-IIB family hydrolase [Lacticaseibacillus daqingensis]
MTKALVFFDLDMTLLNDAKQIPTENLAALHQLQQNDCVPIICTGRNQWELTALQEVSGIDTLICANGADIVLHGEHLYQSPLGKPQLHRFLAQAKADGLPVSLYNDRGVALTAHTADTKKTYDVVIQPEPVIDPDFATREAVTMLLLFTPWDAAGEAVGAQYQADFPELDFFRNGHYAIDVVNHGISKGSGIEILADRPEFAGVPTYAFGDGNNDIPMLRRATVGVAMGNALPAVAAAADYQTDDYQHAGIPNALRHFGLI